MTSPSFGSTASGGKRGFARSELGDDHTGQSRKTYRSCGQKIPANRGQGQECYDRQPARTTQVVLAKRFSSQPSIDSKSRTSVDPRQVCFGSFSDIGLSKSRFALSASVRKGHGSTPLNDE